MSTFDLRDNYVRFYLSEEEDVLSAEPPSNEFLDELFGEMKVAADVRIVIIGQDPFPDRMKRTAMAFSYPVGVAPSDSNLSIIVAANKGMDDHESVETFPDDGYLGSWRDQGVLLINSRGNMPFLTAMMKSYGDRQGGQPVGILLGKTAIDTASAIFETAYAWGHPSSRSLKNNDPTNPEHWNHTDVFWRANNHLLSSGRGFVNWASVYGSSRVYIFCDAGHSAKHRKSKAGYAIFTSLGACIGHRVVVNEYTPSPEQAFSVDATPKRYIASGVVKMTTNNIAELTALRMSFDVIRETHKETPLKDGVIPWKYIIYTDSNYSLMTVTVWYNTWVANDKLTDKKNVPLVSRIVAEYNALPGEVKVRHTNGHQKQPGKGASSLEWLKYWGNTYIDELVSCA